MRKFVILLSLAMLFTYVQAEKIYVTESYSQADMLVKIVDSRASADLVVCITDSYSISETEGRWFFTDSKAQADIVICYVESTAGATKVYFSATPVYSQRNFKRPRDGLKQGSETTTKLSV